MKMLEFLYPDLYPRNINNSLCMQYMQALMNIFISIYYDKNKPSVWVFIGNIARDWIL